MQSTRKFDEFYVYYGAFSMAEHIGTHIDSPQHLTRTEAIAQRNDPIDRVPLHKLVGEACVVDVPEHARHNDDYMITVDDLIAWENVCQVQLC